MCKHPLIPLPIGTTEGLPAALVDVLGMWEKAMHRRNLKERTRQDYQILVSRLLKLVVMKFPSFTAISKLSMTHIDYIEDQLLYREEGSSMGKRTRQSYISAMRMFLKWCYRREHTKKDFHTMIEPIRVPKSPPKDVYSEQEVEDLIVLAGGETPQRKRDQMMATLAYMMGLRSSSVRYASIDDIKWSKKEFVVAKAKGNKSGESLPLPDMMLDLLRNYIKNVRPLLIGSVSAGHNRKHSYADAPSPEKILFPTSSGLPISYGNFLKVVKRAGSGAGIRNTKVHGLRHSIATHMVRRGADILAINILLQHSDLATTMIYLKLDKTRLVDAMGKYHPLLNGALYAIKNGTRAVSEPHQEEGFQRNPCKNQMPVGKHSGSTGASDDIAMRNPIRNAIDGFRREVAVRRKDHFASVEGTIPIVGLAGKSGRNQTQPITGGDYSKNGANSKRTTQTVRCPRTVKQKGGNTRPDPK